jgi:hypothetical protein
MLASSQWSHLSTVFPEEERKELTDFWHRLDGSYGILCLRRTVLRPKLNRIGWPDSSPGLYKLKNHFIVATLSNGNVRLLVDMVESFGSYIYRRVLRLVSFNSGQKRRFTVGCGIFWTALGKL